MKYTINNCVINYSGKCIGLEITSETGESGYIPCYPSTVLKKYNTVYIDNVSVYKNYKDTIMFLNKIKKDSNEKLLCSPKIKVLENELIVGILTETNQFIQLKEPEEDIYGNDLIRLKESNFINNDIQIFENKNIKDDDRVKMIRKLKIETRFYNIFRNIVRLLLNK